MENIEQHNSLTFEDLNARKIKISSLYDGINWKQGYARRQDLKVVYHRLNVHTFFHYPQNLGPQKKVR